MAIFDAVYADPGLTAQVARRNLGDACVAPQDMSPALLDALNETELPAAPKLQEPDWLRQVTGQRDFFESTVFMMCVSFSSNGKSATAWYA